MKNVLVFLNLTHVNLTFCHYSVILFKFHYIAYSLLALVIIHLRYIFSNGDMLKHVHLNRLIEREARNRFNL